MIGFAVGASFAQIVVLGTTMRDDTVFKRYRPIDVRKQFLMLTITTLPLRTTTAPSSLLRFGVSRGLFTAQVVS